MPMSLTECKIPGHLGIVSAMARVVVAVTRWRIPLVPREADELPFPTDLEKLWILYLRRECSAIRPGRHVDV